MKDDYSRICNDLAATWKADLLCNNVGRASLCYDWRVRNGLDNGVIHPNALAIVMGGTYLTKVEHHEAHWRSQPGYVLMLAAAIEAAFPVLPVERAPVLRGGFDAELVGNAISKLYANTRPESGKLFYSREEQATHTVLWLKENGFSELVITSEQLAAAMGNWLVIPMRDVEGKLVGLQFINDEGNKRFLTGSPKKGAFCVIGASPSKIKSAWLCEGYATGVSLLEAKGGAVVICFDCGNMAHLVDVLREQHPDVELSVVGDDDRKTEGNPGRTVVAGILEKHSDVRVMMPAIADNAPIHLSDVNDLVVYRRQCGLPDGEVLIPLHTVH